VVRVDGSVRRLERYLGTDEFVLASFGGREAGGRRRRVLVVTSDRVLITWVRGDVPEEFDLGGVVCRYEARDATFTLRQGDREVALQEVDEMAARVVVQLLEQHHRWAPRPASPTMRVVEGHSGP
jgi:hypothetical protein